MQHMGNEMEANEAIKHLNGHFVEGRKMNVEVGRHWYFVILLLMGDEFIIFYPFSLIISDIYKC